MADKILDVPFYNQLDPSGPLTPEWRDRTCGIQALKMVLDYHRLGAGQGPISLKELFDKTLADHGYLDEAGWFHPALVRAAARYGFLAWRRSWNISQAGIQQYHDEGVDPQSMVRFGTQLKREAIPTLVEEVERGYPVIISVAKNFDEVDKGHLVVLTGISRRDELGKYLGFYYNDPYSPTKNDRKDRYVSISRFLDKWNYRAIFVEPKP